MSGARILVVDDDVAILRAVKRSLAAHGYEVRTLQAGAEVEAMAASFRPDVILLDLVLPDADGMAICRALRVTSAVPIIVLSALGDDRKKVEALDEGADDYVTKPFSVDELLARIRVALRHRARQAREAVLEAGGIRMDIGSRQVTVTGATVHLTPREFDLCRLFIEQAGRVLTQRYILATLWGAEYVDDSHILRTFIYQLRTKLGPAGAAIVTDAGVGYRFTPIS